MTDTVASSSPGTTSAAHDAPAAGALMRAARQQQGLHIAALAASLKVVPAKLEALEAGRVHELPDAAFTRALAKAVCRSLKIDPAPVLALLPGAPPDALGRVDGGLNTPFRERPGRVVPADWAPWRHPVLWLVALLLVAAAAFVLVPSAPLREAAAPVAADSVTGSAADSAAAPVMPPDTAALPTDAAPAAVAPAALAPASGPAALPTPATPGTDALTLRAVQDTWVQAVDGNGQTLLARVVPAGETVALTPALPVRLRIGNARGTELQFRGQPVPLETRDNIANITLP